MVLNDPKKSKDLPLNAALRELNSIIVYLRRDKLKHKEDFNKVYLYTEQMLNLFIDKDPKKINNANSYVKTLIRLANLSFETGHRERIENHIDKLKQKIGIDTEKSFEKEITKISFSKKTPNYHYILLFLITTYYIGIKEFKIAKLIVEHLTVNIDTLLLPKDHLMAIYWSAASTNLLNKDYKSSKVFINKILAFKNDRVRKDIVFRAELLNIITILEEDEDGNEEDGSLIITEIGKRLAGLNNFENSIAFPKHLIEEGKTILNVLVTISLNRENQELNLRELNRLYNSLTKNMGDFITDVFPLWATQKINSISNIK